MTPEQKSALDRLIAHAQRDSGQSRKVAGFLLAWWNAETFGGFHLTDLWSVDGQIRDDMLAVVDFIGRGSAAYPDSLGYGRDFEQIVAQWGDHFQQLQKD